MRIILFILILISLFSKAFATGQEGERIIIKNDTLELLSEPLYEYLSQHEAIIEKTPFLKHGCSTALWRGYVGLWQIQNDSLFFVDVYLCGKKDRSIKDLIFPEQSSKIWADWYSDKLIISIGKPVLYFHSGYERIREKTLDISIVDGLVVSEVEHINGYRPEDSGLSRKPNDVNRLIYQNIDWNSVDKLSSKIKIYISFRINEEGYVNDVEVDENEFDSRYSEELKRILESFGRFKILYWNGQQKATGFGGTIWFSTKEKKKYARPQKN
jgi:hypothetical protein